MFAILSFELCKVFGREYCVICNFYKEKEESITKNFKFVNVPSLPPNVSWYFDWRLLTCGHQSNNLSMSPLMCMRLPPSMSLYACVYGFIRLSYLIYPPLPSPIVHGFLTYTTFKNHYLEVLQLFMVVYKTLLHHSPHTFPRFSISPSRYVYVGFFILGQSSTFIYLSCFKNNVNYIKGSRFKY